MYLVVGYLSLESVSEKNLCIAYSLVPVPHLYSSCVTFVRKGHILSN